MLEWLSDWSAVQTCIWPSWCHCHSLSLASVKSSLVLPFWYRLTRVVPDKGPLSGYVCVCVGLLNCGFKRSAAAPAYTYLGAVHPLLNAAFGRVARVATGRRATRRTALEAKPQSEHDAREHEVKLIRVLRHDHEPAHHLLHTPST